MSAKHFVLISTIDVYCNKIGVDEDSKININKLDHYGYNRHDFEQFVISLFRRSYIIRLPMLFGHGLKRTFFLIY